MTIVAWRFWSVASALFLEPSTADLSHIFRYAYSNRKRDRVAAAAGITEEEMERVGKLMGEEDKTDRENPQYAPSLRTLANYKLTLSFLRPCLASATRCK